MLKITIIKIMAVAEVGVMRYNLSTKHVSAHVNEHYHEIIESKDSLAAAGEACAQEARDGHICRPPAEGHLHSVDGGARLHYPQYAGQG